MNLRLRTFRLCISHRLYSSTISLFIVCLPSKSAPPRWCWVGNAASSVCAVGQRTHPAEVQSEQHLPSNVVLGQLVTERPWPGEWYSTVILKFTIAGVRRCSLTAGSWSQHPQPHRSGSTVVVAHPDIGQRLSFLFF